MHRKRQKSYVSATHFSEKGWNSRPMLLTPEVISSKNAEPQPSGQAEAARQSAGFAARAVAAEGVWLRSREPAATGSRRIYTKGSYGNRHGEVVQ
jgi:hypothetical protein